VTPIARISTPFTEKFGTPRQPGLITDAQGVITFEPEYRNPDALRGLESASHLWLIFLFDRNPQDKPWTPTVRPPRLGGNKRLGVFATRSPFRPNPIVLSAAKIERIDLESPDGPVIHVSGIDLVNGTAILDIKPYIPYADSIPEATHPTFATAPTPLDLPIEISDEPSANLLAQDQSLAQLIEHTLRLDPRPSYHDDPHHSYGMALANHEIRFRITSAAIVIESITEQSPQ